MNHNRRMPARLSAFVIWALVAASVAFWGLRLFVKPPVAPSHTQLASDSGPARVDLTRLLGAAPVAMATSVQAPAISSRFQLTGVMAPKVAGQQGIALIAVDGKMPRAYRIGAPIDGDLVLQSVSLRTASIGPPSGAPAAVLELPPLPAAATGSLPPAASLVPPTSGPVPPVAAAPMPVAPVAPPTQAVGEQGEQAVPPKGPRRSRGMGMTPRDQAQQQMQPGSTQ
jgi:general secretion pathway protein C